MIFKEKRTDGSDLAEQQKLMDENETRDACGCMYGKNIHRHHVHERAKLCVLIEFISNTTQT